jgi:hypothetical protein
MSVYPPPDEIEAKWRASGSGVCVIVEGETELDDAWFYNRWFGYRAKEVTFFPQDGWEQVVNAVTVLRERVGSKSVYGIIDRDFEEEVIWEPMPEDGIQRTRWFTLENYLLDPDCWFSYIRQHTRRYPSPGWNKPEEVQVTIAGFYNRCLPLSAYNWVLHEARKLDYDAFKTLEDRVHKAHPKAIDELGDVAEYLRGVQQQMRLGEDLGQLYEERLAALQEMPSEQLDEVVSGKWVLKLLSEQFPLKLSGKQAWNSVLGAYLDHCPDPPNDLAALIDRIIEHAHS